MYTYEDLVAVLYIHLSALAAVGPALVQPHPQSNSNSKGSFIYDVHTRVEGVRLSFCHIYLMPDHMT